MSFQTLPGGQLQIGFRFDLLDKSHNTIGQLSPISESPPRISNSINRTIKRQLADLVLPAADVAAINTLTDRVRPWAITGPSAQFSLGVFLFADATRVRRTYSSVQLTQPGSQVSQTGSMLDQLCTIDQAVEKTVAYKPGTVIATALDEQMQQSPALEWNIDPSSARIRGTEWFIKPAGTSRLEVINDLAQLGSYYTLHFDNNGVGQIRLVPDLVASAVDFEYGEGSTVYSDTITETDDLLHAPNRYIVVNNSLNDESVFGFWDIPTTSPNSIANRGFVVAKVIDMQGVESDAEATDAAKAFGQADYSTYAWATFATVINPLHDTNNIVGWRGVKYREQSWDFQCRHDAQQNHELRRIYAEEVPV